MAPAVSAYSVYVHMSMGMPLIPHSATQQNPLPLMSGGMDVPWMDIYDLFSSSSFTCVVPFFQSYPARAAVEGSISLGFQGRRLSDEMS